jgi:hypothetical protein
MELGLIVYVARNSYGTPQRRPIACSLARRANSATSSSTCAGKRLPRQQEIQQRDNAPQLSVFIDCLGNCEKTTRQLRYDIATIFVLKRYETCIRRNRLRFRYVFGLKVSLRLPLSFVECYLPPLKSLERVIRNFISFSVPVILIGRTAKLIVKVARSSGNFDVLPSYFSCIAIARVSHFKWITPALLL